jgi:hypothetical protein
MREILENAAPAGFCFTHAWVYKDAEGNGIGAMARYDAIVANGKRDKTFYPFVRDGDEIVRRGFPEPRPLYHLDQLAARPDAPVLVVEGEKAADAAADIFPDYVTTTSPHGSQSAGKADWSPLSGRDVTIWPDHDTAGANYARDVLERVPQSKLVTLPAFFPSGWDLADDTPRGMTDDVLVDLLKSASTPPPAEPQKKKANGKASPEALAESVKEAMAEADAAALEAAPSLDEVLNSVSEFLARFICYPSPHARIAHTLWIAHTHLMEAWHTTPRLAFMSVEKESGKTRALEITELLVPSPVLSINSSPAATITMISLGMVTILFDEIDALYGSAKAQEQNADLCAVMNGGYRRGAYVYRCVMQGSTRGIEKLSSFAPLAIAGLRTLPDTLASRSIMIRMRRRAPDEAVEQFRLRKVRAPAVAIYNDLALRCREIEQAMKSAEPEMPAGIVDRSAECWEPLLAIADAAGGAWPKVARAAAVALKKGAADTIQSHGVLLLQHIKEAFMGEDRLWTEQLIGRLTGRAESPWNDIRGKPINDRGLAERLKPFEVSSRDIRVGDLKRKGYRAEDFHDVWNRYLSGSSPPERDKRDKRDIIDNNNNNVADVADVAADTGGTGNGHFDRDERISTLMSVNGFTREQAEAAVGWEDRA